jgi:hypothetical protein
MNDVTIEIDDKGGQIILALVEEPEVKLELGVWTSLNGEYLSLNKEEARQVLVAIDNWISFGRLVR